MESAEDARLQFYGQSLSAASTHPVSLRKPEIAWAASVRLSRRWRFPLWIPSAKFCQDCQDLRLFNHYRELVLVEEGLEEEEQEQGNSLGPRQGILGFREVFLGESQASTQTSNSHSKAR